MEDMTTIGEILEFAIKREIEAAEFYIAMAGRVENPATGKFFDELATEEFEHKSRLELEVMKEGIVAKTVGVLPDTSLDNSVVDLDKVKSEMDYLEALAVAIQKEKRSFRLYTKLSGMVDEEKLSETLLSLAEEEVKHIIAFEELYKSATIENK